MTQSYASSHIKEKKTLKSNDCDLSTGIMVDHAQTVSFAIDIARGMSFLHAMDPLIPKYYLNSKNIMVSLKFAQLFLYGVSKIIQRSFQVKITKQC